MSTLKRRSPVTMPGSPAEKENRGGWDVVLKYQAEGDGPYLVDLSHRTKLDFQDGDVASHQPLGMDVPEMPGDSAINGEFVINRQNGTQCSIWHLGGKDVPEVPEDIYFTEVTDGLCMLAVIGEDAHEIMERVTKLDLTNPTKSAPFLSQGPVQHIPAQVNVLGAKNGQTCVVFTFSRGYGQTFVESMLHSGEDFGLRPGGEDAFTQWFAK